MRIVSTRLNMIESFNENEYFKTIVNWLKGAGPCKAIGDQIEACIEKIDIHLESEYCKADTFQIAKEETTFLLFKLEQLFHEQTWITEVIFKCAPNSKEVYFHIDCLHDVTRFDEAPEMRTEIIRTFINSGFVKQPRMPITSNPIDAADNLLDLLTDAIRGEYKEYLPLILVTTYFDSMATEINELALAKKLAGLAYVVVCDNEYTRLLKDKTKCSTPYNGAIAIYCKGGKPKQYRKNDAFHGGTLDVLIANEIQRFVTAVVDAEAPTWEALYTEMIHTKSKQNEEMLGMIFDENESLDEQLKKAKLRISELAQENIQLKAKNVNLEAALKVRDMGQPVLKKSSIPEFFEGEQHDLVVSILKRALTTGGTSDTRRHELLADILKENKINGNGKEVFDVVKSIFSSGEELSERDIAELKRIGFKIVSESPHYKLIYKDSKYWFTVSKTASDKKRSGKNLMSDITKRLSVYK